MSSRSTPCLSPDEITSTWVLYYKTPSLDVSCARECLRVCREIRQLTRQCHSRPVGNLRARIAIRVNCYSPLPPRPAVTGFNRKALVAMSLGLLEESLMTSSETCGGHLFVPALAGAEAPSLSALEKVFNAIRSFTSGLT